MGNNRIVANAAASAVQSTQYYPFGASFADGIETGTQPCKYNGKEFDTRNGLNMYDYSVRWKADWYFSTMDPLAEEYYSISPYVYCANNPLKYIDPDRKALNIVTGGLGALISTGVNIYNQSKEGKLDWSSGETWGRIGIAATAGFVAGATGNIAIAVAANTSGNIADQFISKGDVDAGEVATAAVLTVVGAGASKVVANTGVVQSSSRGIASTVSKNANKAETMSKTGYGGLTNYIKEGITPFSKDAEKIAVSIGATTSQAGVESVNQVLSTSNEKTSDKTNLNNNNKTVLNEEDIRKNYNPK